MWYSGNGNMDFIMNEVFIRVMDKLNEKLQLHVKSWAMP
jgi:hypothetical protein